MLKWTRKKSHAWINDMFNHAWLHGMPYDQITNGLNLYTKAEMKIYGNNYQIIMVGSLMTKLFGCIMESKISAWAGKNGKRAYSQVGFKKHNSTINHLINL